MLDEAFEMLEMELEERLEKFASTLSKVRTGRASVSLLDDVRADFYGSPTPLNQMATLSVPEPQLIVIAPWDKSVLGAIEKAVLASDLGLNPNNDGTVVRIAIPQLTGERRQDLVKQVRKYTEECRIALRQIRRSYNEQFKKAQKDSQISEDEQHRATDRVQEMIDKAVERAEAANSQKEAEILEV